MDVKHTQDLLDALLRRPENSEDMIEELNFYVSDLKDGELLESDVRYIQALAKRLGVAPRSGARPDRDAARHTVPTPGSPKPDASAPDAPRFEETQLDVPGHDVPGDAPAAHDVPGREIVPGSFLDRARTLARETMEEHRPANEADRRTMLDRISDQLAALAARLEEEVLNDARGEGVLPIPTGQLRMALMRDGDMPALFVAGNEKELKTTPGYMALAAKCDELALRLKLEDGHERGYGRPEEPASYLVDVVISGWV